MSLDLDALETSFDFVAPKGVLEGASAVQPSIAA